MIAETQWLFTEAELQRTPSILEGIPLEKERENRSKGVNFVLQVGIMLKLPQITLATASVFLHRFYMRHSMQNYHYYSMAATSLHLAYKVEENVRKMKELVIACVRVAQKDPHKMVDEQDKEYWRWRDNIIQYEDVLLEAICFDLSLEPPYKTLFDLLRFFGEENNKRLRNAAWAFVNDSCLTILCLLFPSRTIATSALYAAAKFCDVSFPDDARGRPWWEEIGVDVEDIRKACNYMASIYEGAPSKPGREGGMYERTPEIGVDADDKTRAARPRVGDRLDPEASVEVPNGTATGGLGYEERHAKRARDDGTEADQKPATNGAGYEAIQETTSQDPNGSLRKRQRIEIEGSQPNGHDSQSEQAAVTDGTGRTLTGHSSDRALPIHAAAPAEKPVDEGGLISPKLDDDVSEEGEVEA